MKLGLTGALAAWVSVLCSAGVGQVVTAEALRAAHLSRAEQISIHQTPTPDEGVTLEFTALGRNFMVDLRPSTVRAPGAVLVEAAGDQQREVPWPPAATFIGEIRDLAGSIVAGAVVNGRWRLVIDQGPQRPGALFVQPWSEILGGPQEGYAAYAETDLLPGDWTCGAGAAQLLPAQSPRGYGSRAACNTLAQVAFDADFEFYQANGSSTATAIADIESVVNTMNVIYARDTNIIHQISYTLIRTAEPDPYTTTNAGGVLDEFAAEWQNNQSGVTRDIAHLMTGKEIDGNVIGVAYVGAVCTYGYGYSQSRFTTNLAYRTGLTAHEIGHNWGAGHCDGDSDCYIMCSGIGGCSGNVTRFGSRSIRDIRAFVPTRTCLEAADGFPTPVPPRPQADQAATTVNTPVRIDVLANDFDGNCETVTILSFPARANCGHGSLARSVGTGPGGRDEIRYTPDAGFSGADCFTYSARDPSGRSDSASVAITVLPLRTPDNPPFPEPGLSAAYYHTLPAELADLSLTTPYLSGTVATVNFPASSDPFATSGRAVGVGAIFTGTLNIATGGAYTLFTESDDGSALYVNNLLLVANDGPQGMTERSGAVSLPAGPAQIRIEYFQGAGAGGLIARIQGPSLPKQVIPASMWAAPGVHVDYYNLGNEINDLPDLAALTPASRDIVSTLNQPTVDPYFFGSARRTNLAASFIGYFNAPTAGLYRFFTTSDDASALWIGNTLVVDNRGAHGMVERSGYAALAAGRHAIRVEYWQGGGGAGLIVEAEGPSMARAPIPATAFSHAPAAATDCNSDGVNDSLQAVERLDLGDMLAGGDGRGGAPIAAGVIASNGLPASPTAFGASGTLLNGTFSPLNGLGGRPNRPRVEGVLVPRNLTPLAPGLSRTFPAAGGGYWDAIRNAGTIFASGVVAPIILADKPGISRPGIGMHADSGVTFDLAEIRAAEGGRPIHRLTGICGYSINGCITSDLHEEFLILVDGQERFRRLICTQATLAWPFDVAISASDRYLTLISLNADGNTCDHLAVADAVLTISSALDDDGDGTLDSCACPADFNGDGGVDGADVEAFYRAWESGETSADVNHDGGIDGADVETFFAAWEAGGC